MWNVCFDFFCNFCLKHLSFQEELSGVWSQMCIGLHVKYLLFLSDFHEICIFLTFPKSTQMSNFVKIRPVWTELFHANRRTDSIMKLIFAFLNFVNAPKNHNGAHWIWWPSSLFSFFCYLGLMHNEFVHRGQTLNKEFYTFCDIFEKEGRGNDQNFGWSTTGFFTMIMPQCTWHMLFTSFLCKTRSLCSQYHPVALICQQETSHCSRKWKLA